MIYVIYPIIYYSVRELCKTPYYNHPKGCPNYNKKLTCPPNANYYDKVYDLHQPIFAVVNKFDLKSHVNNMKEKHPNWTEKQLYCVLYWQSKARKQLREKIEGFLEDKKYYYAETCPEAMGVDLISTMKQVNIELIFPVKDVAYQIALCGKLK